MNRYVEFKKERDELINNYVSATAFFAFNNEQFYEGLSKFGMKTKEQAKEFFYQIANGSFMLKNKVGGYHYLIDKYVDELNELTFNDEEFAYDMFYYELGNYEYCYSQDDYTVIGACGLNIKDFEEHKGLREVYGRARRDYLNNVEM